MAGSARTLSVSTYLSELSSRLESLPDGCEVKAAHFLEGAFDDVGGVHDLRTPSGKPNTARKRPKSPSRRATAFWACAAGESLAPIKDTLFVNSAHELEFHFLT
jgi:hypothetical protein